MKISKKLKLAFLSLSVINKTQLKTKAKSPSYLSLFLLSFLSKLDSTLSVKPYISKPCQTGKINDF